VAALRSAGARRDRIVSALAFRPHLARGHNAALYSDWPHAFSDADVAVGSIFAAYCPLTLHTELLMDEGEAYRTLHAQSRRLHEDLHRAARRIRNGSERPTD
jgi:hypothetical protein